jgi:serine/threonine protein kinase
VPQSILQPLRRWDPERIGPYALIGRLGAGAMGQVFLARSAAGRLVAVKTIRIELAEEPGFRARFAREVAAARRVSGVFTAAVVEADADADLPWVATAYVPAPSLRTLVSQSGPLPLPAVRWLAAGCAEALASIHGAGLVHRDVKPSNVLVAPDGPRVIDFGVARAAERIELTATRGAAGTPAYMAPEQARDATRVSPASDVFSLGATLVFAATGHPPYHGETAIDTLVRLATEPPDLTGLPPELTDLVGACLQRVPRDRPTDAAILDQLGSFAHLGGAGHSYLPDSAMALIADYQDDPAGTDPGGDVDTFGDSGADAGSWPTDGSGAEATGNVSSPDDATSGSHTALPGFEPPPVLAAAPGAQAGPGKQAATGGGEPGEGPGSRAGPDQPPRPGGNRGRLRPRTGWAWAGAAAGALALLAAGAGLGVAVDRPSAPSPSQSPSPSQPLGPVQARVASCPLSGASSSTPILCVNLPIGDGDTVFILYGTGFTPFAPVTVRLTGAGISRTSRFHPIADMQGTFSYAIDQGHYFFPGQIPAGTYTAQVATPGGGSVHVTFKVHPPGQAPPPGPPA